MEKEERIVFEIKPRGKTSLGLAELWQYRELFYFFTWRDIKVKYKQTVLGFLWAILQPLIMMIIFTLLFGSWMNKNNTILPYPLFVLSGLLLWNIFSSGVSNSGNSMVTNANMIKKIYFPRLIIPISSILVSVFDFFMTLIVFIPIVIYFQLSYNVSVSWLTFFPGLAAGLILTAFTAFGTGTLLAALNVKYRDFRYVIPFLIQVLLFITPVIYPLSIIQNEYFAKLLAANPMYGAVEIFRCGINGTVPHWHLIFLSLSTTVIVFISGLYYFRKTEFEFADLA